jgi:hypothetical protein
VQRNGSVALLIDCAYGPQIRLVQEPAMTALKQTALAVAAAAPLCMPVAPAMAAGPLLLAPLVLGGHILGAVTRLAALPFVAASAAMSAPYPPGGYYGQPSYYPLPSAYYGASRAYPPVISYPYYSAPRYYGPPRGYYAPATRYSGYYGGQASYRSRSYSYRRR